MRENSAAEPRATHVDYDAELQLLNEVLRSSSDIRSHDQVLDIGCGAGQTTRDAARLAVSGAALGVDLCARMIERARLLTEAARLHNVTFEQADAQMHRFVAERFDVAISRFGTMFFADPVAAFSNIAGAIRPSGRLHMMVWQDQHKNEWSVSIQQAIGGSAEAPAPSSRMPDAFSLANPRITARILESAGFEDITFTEVGEPVYYGQDIDAALEWVSGFSNVSAVLQGSDADAAARAREKLREAFAAHAGQDGVWFDSRAWIVAARRR